MKQSIIKTNFDKFVLGFSAIGLVSILFYVVLNYSLSVLVFSILFFLLGVILTWNSGKESVQIFLLGYFLSIFFSVLIYFIYSSRYSLPYFLGGSDDLHFELDAQIVIDNSIWIYNRNDIAFAIGNIYHNSVGYVYFLSLIIRVGDLLGGYDTMMSRVFNCFLLGLSGVLIKSISLQLNFNRENAKIGALWVLLFPMMIFTTIHVFRDNLTLIILLICLYFSLKISFSESTSFDFKWIKYSFPIILLTPLIIQLRMMYVLPMLAMLLSALTFRVLPLKKIKFWHFFLAMPILLLFYVLISQNELFQAAIRLKNFYDNMLSGGEQSSFGGLSNFLFNLPQPIQTVARFFYALITPLPIFYSDIEWTVLGLGTIIQILYFYFVLLGFKLVCREVKYLPLILGFSIIFISYFTGTFTFRHITQWWPFAVLLGMLGYSQYRHLRKMFFSFSIFFLVLGGLMYAWLKII